MFSSIGLFLYSWIFWSIIIVCSLLNSFKYSKWLNSFIWLTDGLLTGTNTLGQSEPGSNGNDGVLHIPQSSKTGDSLLDSFSVISGPSLGEGVAPQLTCSRRVLKFAQPIWLRGSGFYDLNVKPFLKILRTNTFNWRIRTFFEIL